MAIKTFQKTMFVTSDGKEHTTRRAAMRHETCITLHALGFKPETSAKLTSMSVDALRATAETLIELANEAERLARGDVDGARDSEDDEWGGANVAPRPDTHHGRRTQRNNPFGEPVVEGHRDEDAAPRAAGAYPTLENEWDD